MATAGLTTIRGDDSTVSVVTAEPARARRIARRRALKSAVSVAFLALAGWFLYREFRDVEPAAIRAVLASLPLTGLLVAGLATIASYFTLSLFDFLAVRQFGLGLGYFKTLATSFVSYAFNFNLGSLVGAVGLRYRLYSKWRISIGDIGRITVYAAATSWLGYALVAGITLTLAAPATPERFALPLASFRLFGVAFLTLAVAYVVLCHRREHPLRIRHWRYELPEKPEALLQLGVSSAQWLLVATIIFSLLPRAYGITYVDVLSTQLIAAFAGLLLHVPGGLGVIEGVYLLLLGPRVPKDVLLGTLIAYRSIYYLMPLVVAAGTLLILELRPERPAR